MGINDRITDQYYVETPPFNFDREAVANIILDRSFGESQTNDIIGYHVATHKEINKIQKHLRLPYLSHALFFDLPPMSRFPIHIDKVYSMQCDHYSLNIPVRNTAMTNMNWWVHDKPGLVKNFSNEYEVHFHENQVSEIRYIKSQRYKGEKNPKDITTSPIAPFEECTMIHSCTMDKPHLVKVDDWHNVDNNDPNERSLFLAVRFDAKFTEPKLREFLGI
jgi:hypothetical protein